MLASAGFLLLIMVLTDIFYADEMLTNKNTGGKGIFFSREIFARKKLKINCNDVGMTCQGLRNFYQFI